MIILFYSTQEIAKILKLSEATVLRLIHEGELKAVRLGRTYRIHDSVLDTLIESGLIPAAGEN